MALSIQKVGVIGAGQMGNGIAHVCSLAGFDVSLFDVAPDRVKAGIATINGNMARQVGKKVIAEDDRKQALARIQPAETFENLARHLYYGRVFSNRYRRAVNTAAGKDGHFTGEFARSEF